MGNGTAFPHGLKDKDNTLIDSTGIADVEQTSAADDVDHTKIAADIAALVAEVNKLNALIKKIVDR